jgi:cell division protein FtsI/penicillin-binding protein 2
MGQEVSVTTLQLAQAASVIANGGMLVKPRLVLKKGDQVQPAATPVRVLKAENAITMRQMMEGVVLYGTGTKARLEGYSSGEGVPPRSTISKPSTIRTPTMVPTWVLRR